MSNMIDEAREKARKNIMDKQLTDQEKESYINGASNRCPKCKSEDIAGYAIEVDAGGCWQTVSCNECHAEWNDIYTLRDVEIVIESDDDTQSN